MAQKIRLDVAVFEGGYTDSREKAKALIMAGQVYVNNQKADKPGQILHADDQLEVRGGSLAFVSRGGLKLDKAINTFSINLADCVCMDIGASTGGFTDCMLQNGALKVYAIDVGYGQLAWKLRTNSQVINMERTNFRHVIPEQIPDIIDFASIDVSFISLRIILPVLYNLLKNNAYTVALIKPQFEAGKEKVGKKGVVRDSSVHEEVITNCINYMLDAGFSVLGLTFSPIRGPEGNIEYLAYIQKSGAPQLYQSIDVAQTVKDSHTTFTGGDII